MTTQKTFTATVTGPVWADVTSHVGAVTVTVDPTIERALVTVSTPDKEGPAADAVRRATIREHVSNGVDVLDVRVPRMNSGTVVSGSGTATMKVGSVTFTTSGSGCVSVVRGDIYVGGRAIVENGRVTAERGTIVSGPGVSSTIAVAIRVPELSSVRLDTTSADLRVTGDLQVLDVRSVSGDVLAQGVHTLRCNLTSGDLEVERIEARVDISSVSSDVEIGAYSGSDLRANSVSGDIAISATPASVGAFTVSTVSGDIEARGCAHLRPRLSTVSGQVRPRRS